MLPGLPLHCDEDPEGWCGCSVTTLSKKRYSELLPNPIIDQTHVEDIQDSIEVPSPSNDRILVVPGVEGAGEWVSFASCGDSPLNLSHSSAIRIPVSRWLCIRVGGLTHSVS